MAWTIGRNSTKISSTVVLVVLNSSIGITLLIFVCLHKTAALIQHQMHKENPNLVKHDSRILIWTSRSWIGIACHAFMSMEIKVRDFSEVWAWNLSRQNVMCVWEYGKKRVQFCNYGIRLTYCHCETLFLIHCLFSCMPNLKIENICRVSTCLFKVLNWWGGWAAALRPKSQSTTTKRGATGCTGP